MSFGSCFLASLGVKGLSICRKDGCSAPGSQQLKQHCFSRQGEQWGPHGSQGHWLHWEPWICHWTDPSKSTNHPFRQPGPALSEITVWLKKSVFSLPFTFSVKATSHFRLILIRLQKTSERPYLREGERLYSFRQAREERRLCAQPLGH